ncbi:MAG: AbrB/MazE/SpoVT family DNA-binding domain-containing protein [Candidatus Marinimicrobia bacterium]|nr:AbrB/MazE/SpoVT family DNA-binding domain-containing protein [Candidatus Neomarinimicrobiota bacterium]MCK4446779.1 AbrB/MazE/SpoVT family DNA-binding domain-containing protein [Candidatus Neomarinimicrobiota bacterium]
MTLTRVKKNFQITLPNQIRRKFNISVGDYIIIDEEERKIVIKPVKIVDSDQEYFYTKEWQEKEAQADRDLAEGRYKEFDNVEDLIKDLNS